MTTDLARAQTTLVRALRDLRNADGGWPYYAGKASRIEPTCWACLGLGIPLDTTPLPQWSWDSGLLIEPTTRQPNHAFNGLAALVAGGSGDTPRAQRIVRAIAETGGQPVPDNPVIKLNGRLRGWAWFDGTFSWIEPTAWCLLSLKRWRTVASAAAGRVRTAEAILRDRACTGGGWNYGNATVYGTSLPAHVPPTAVGVLAMQDRTGETDVAGAVSFLERQAPAEGSATALALSVLALAVVERPVAPLATALARDTAQAVTFGNAATLGMAAYALQCVIDGRRPPAFTLERVGR